MHTRILMEKRVDRDMTSSEKTTVTLTIDYNHQLKLSATLHTIVGTFEGPDSDRLKKKLYRESHIKPGENGTVQHGPYMFIAFGLRNMIFRLRRIGMAWDEIHVGGKTADQFLEEVFPDRDYVNKEENFPR